MQILSEVVMYDGLNMKKGSIWVVGGLKSLFALNGPQVPAWALREMLGLLGRDFEGGFCFFLIGELPYRYAPLWGSSPIGMLPYGGAPL